MHSTFFQIALVVAGLAIFTGLYIGYPGKGLRGGIVVIAIVIAAAFVLTAIDRLTP
jgi:hypothetical protein